MDKRPNPLRSTILTILAAVLLFVVYWYGWRVTEIDLVTLITDVADVKPIVNSLLRPRLLEQEEFTQRHKALIWVPCADAYPDMEVEPLIPGAPYVTVSSDCANVGQPVTVEGYDFEPNVKGSLRWVVGYSRRRIDYVTTDADGEFVYTFKVPEVEFADEPINCGVEFIASWREGPLQPTEPLRLTWEKMIETIFLALMATTLGIVVAIPLSFLGAHNLMGNSPVGLAIYYVTRTFFNLLRSIEPLIMAIVFAVWVGIGPFAGVLALAVHSIAALGKLYSEAIESIDEGPIEAITSTGANRLQVIFYAVIPQIVPQYLAFTIYRWDINVRMSTIIGFVGGGGIGFILQQWINLLQYRNAAVAVWAIAIVVATLDYVSAKVREKIV